ncbi:MAG: hypothetical protein QOG06_2217 [Gaiellaceae bacterium]|nr:hypothetical protein [Gaiellaceae bacterium]
MAAVPTRSDWTQRPPDARGPRALVTPVAAAVGATSSSSTLPPLLLGAALLVALLAVAVASVPASVLPRHINVLAYEHRETVIAGGTALAISIALGLAIALFGS